MVDGEQAAELWAMVPGSAFRLPRAGPLRVLGAYSKFANRYRITFVSENRIADALGWYYGPKKIPNRRNVIKHRATLLNLEFMVDAGLRLVPGANRTWVKAYLIAPYSQEQRLDLTMRSFVVHDAFKTHATMRSPRTHIQRVTETDTEEQNGKSAASSPLRGSQPPSEQNQRRSEEEEPVHPSETTTQQQALDEIAAFEAERKERMRQVAVGEVESPWALAGADQDDAE
jgi:hypothetical protein